MLQSIDRLKVFYHVFDKGSVISAAKSLNVSQSSVSQSLQKLESEIKSPLFTRLYKKLVPTAAGERLFATIIQSIWWPRLFWQLLPVRKTRSSFNHTTGQLH